MFLNFTNNLAPWQIHDVENFSLVFWSFRKHFRNWWPKSLEHISCLKLWFGFVTKVFFKYFRGDVRDNLEKLNEALRICRKLNSGRIRWGWLADIQNGTNKYQCGFFLFSFPFNTLSHFQLNHSQHTRGKKALTSGRRSGKILAGHLGIEPRPSVMHISALTTELSCHSC